MQGVIYKITNPKGKIYIGQTINFKVRIQSYKALRCKNQPKLYNSLLKYGFENHKIEILANCEKDNLNQLERFYQELYLSCTLNGLNIILTKTDDKRASFTQESRQKMSIAKIGVKRSKDVCDAISLRMKLEASKRPKEYYKNFKGKIQTEEHKIKNSEAKKGNTFRRGSIHSEESKLKMSEARIGKKCSEETKLKMRQSAISAWQKRKNEQYIYNQ